MRPERELATQAFPAVPAHTWDIEIISQALIFKGERSNLFPLC